MNSTLKQRSRKTGGGRFSAIDGVRGLAALSVVFFHLSSNLKPGLQELLPDVVSCVFSYGYLGVPVFFVISGFVVSYSVGFSKITPQYAATFVLRRNIRLNPAYWASILFTLMLINFKNNAIHTYDLVPSTPGIIAHFFYLQDILSIKPGISVVYWTLCLEVQFYLFFLFIRWISQLTAHRHHESESSFFQWLLILSGVYSIFIDLNLCFTHIPGMFIGNWHYFLMGVLFNHVVRETPGSKRIFFAWIAFEGVCQFVLTPKSYTITALFFSVFLYTLRQTDRLGRTLNGPVLRYLGKTSYSLYLVHPALCWTILSIAKYRLNDTLSPVMSGTLFFMCTTASLVIAHLFYILFEKPSLHVCSTLKEGFHLPGFPVGKSRNCEVDY